jgi:effector-binding domain-containing protein
MKSARVRMIFLVLILCGALRLFGQTDNEETGFSIKEIPPFSYIYFSYWGPLSDMEKAIGELKQALESQGQSLPAESLICFLYENPISRPMSGFRWGIGFPATAGDQTVKHPLSKKSWDFHKAAVGIHQDSLETIGATIARIGNWLYDNGFLPGHPVLIRYLDREASQVKPGALRIEVCVPYWDESAMVFPDAFLGEWIFEKSIGGIHGKGNLAYNMDKIVITSSNRLDSYWNNQLISSKPFKIIRAGHPLSKVDTWVIRFIDKNRGETGLSLSKDNTLELVPGVMVEDGYVYYYKRATLK